MIKLFVVMIWNRQTQNYSFWIEHIPNRVKNVDFKFYLVKRIGKCIAYAQLLYNYY